VGDFLTTKGGNFLPPFVAFWKKGGIFVTETERYRTLDGGVP
jgi:hypothetical protein